MSSLPPPLPPQGLPPPPPLPPPLQYQGPVMQYATPGATGMPCPKCNYPVSKPVTFTLWGGVLGPKLLHHVKCLQCGTAYNGKTGQSNTTGIIIYTAVGAFIGIAIFIVFLMFGKH